MSELNVFKFGFLPLTYWKNWFRNIKQFFLNFKWAYQRATKGFCDRDTFALDSFYLKLFNNTLTHLSQNAHGCPINWEYEEWITYLSEMAIHFENAQEWHEDTKINKDVSDCYDMVLKYYGVDKEKYNIAKDQWFLKEKEAFEYREQEKNIGLDMMKKVFFDLWD